MSWVKRAASSPLKRCPTVKYSSHEWNENVLKIAVCNTPNCFDLNIFFILSPPPTHFSPMVVAVLLRLCRSTSRPQVRIYFNKSRCVDCDSEYWCVSVSRQWPGGDPSTTPTQADRFRSQTHWSHDKRFTRRYADDTLFYMNYLIHFTSLRAYIWHYSWGCSLIIHVGCIEFMFIYIKTTGKHI